MRDRNLTFIQFNKEVEKSIRKKLKLLTFLTEAVFINPTLLTEDLLLRFPSRKLQDYQSLALISYYVPEFLGWKIRLNLMEKMKYFSTNDQLRINPMLINRGICILFLFETEEFSSHEIFGTLIEKGIQNLRKIEIFEKKNPKVVPLIRRRGYKDKGSRRRKEQWLPSFDESLTSLQNELEERKQICSKILQFQEEYFKKKKFLKDQEDLE